MAKNTPALGADSSEQSGPNNDANTGVAGQDPTATSTGATGTSEAAKAAEHKVARAPQKRILHIFYKPTTDTNGQPSVEIVKVLSDARKVVEFIDTPEYQGQGLKRFKYEVVSEPRGSKEEVGE